MTYSGLNPGRVCQSVEPVFGSMGSASTPVENIVIIRYFEKRSDFIRKKPVNLAGLQCHPIRAGGVGGSMRRKGRYWRYRVWGQVYFQLFGRVKQSAKIQVVSQFRDGLEMNKFTCFLKILILPLDRVSSWRGWQCARPRMRSYHNIVSVFTVCLDQCSSKTKKCHILK